MPAAVAHHPDEDPLKAGLESQHFALLSLLSLLLNGTMSGWCFIILVFYVYAVCFLGHGAMDQCSSIEINGAARVYVSMSNEHNHVTNVLKIA